MQTDHTTNFKNASIQGVISDLNTFKTQLSDIIENGIDDFFPKDALSYPNEQYAEFVMSHKLNREERLLLILALLPYLDPTLLTRLMGEKNPFRLIPCTSTGCPLPSGETFLQLVSRTDTEKRLEALSYLGTDHLFYKKSIIDLGKTDNGLPSFFGMLKLTPSYVDLFLYNRHNTPRFSTEFPAHHLETHMDWNDLIINPTTANKLNEIKAFLDFSETLREEWGLKKHMKSGYRCLFYGPSGTGKTLAATLLGKHIGRYVYRVDISSVVSKYIGETSKNLNSLFNTAEDKNWILFFDEGDALFGKRVDTAQSDDNNSHFANQDIAYLLQRIENYNGLVIVASNFKKNMDDAFSRRFQNTVHFDILNAELSKQYWLDNLPKQVSLAPAINLDTIVQRDKLSPASIINIINRVCLKTIQKGSTEIAAMDLDLCIKDEIYK